MKSTSRRTAGLVDKQELGRRVTALLDKKGWNFSDLHRAADIGRDMAAAVAGGVRVPKKPNMDKIARALNVDPVVLYPNRSISAINQNAPAFEVVHFPGKAGTAWLTVRQLVATETANAVTALLSEDTEHALYIEQQRKETAEAMKLHGEGYKQNSLDGILTHTTKPKLARGDNAPHRKRSR